MRLFGPTHEDIWKMLSEEIDAEFIIEDSIFKKYKVVKEFHGWNIILDTFGGSKSEPTSTRIYCDFLNKSGFKFKIFGGYFKNYLLSFFDMKDIKLDQGTLSENFIVRSNSEVAIKRFLQNNAITEIINSQPDILLEIVSKAEYDVTAEANSVLCIKVPGVIKNNETLKNLFELVGESLLEIENINSNIEGSQVNNFTRFDVMKNSVKNVLLQRTPYKRFKGGIISNSKNIIYKRDNSYLYGKNKANKSILVKISMVKKNKNNGVAYTENSNSEIKDNSSGKSDTVARIIGMSGAAMMLMTKQYKSGGWLGCVIISVVAFIIIYYSFVYKPSKNKKNENQEKK